MRGLTRFAPLLAVVFSLSCADMPMAPRQIVTITGQITDRDGPGISQMYVVFSSLDPRELEPGLPIAVVGAPLATDSHTLTTVTDGTGRFKLTLPEGPYRVWLYPSSDYPEISLTRVNAVQGFVLNYRFDGVRISGTLTGPGGMALTTAGVGVFRYDPETDTAISANSDVVGGRYSLLVPPGVYEIRGASSGNVGLPRFISSIAVARDTTVDIALEGHRIQGVVTGQNGAPLNRIQLRARALSPYDEVVAYSIEDGSYTMYLPASVYSFELRPWDLYYIVERQYTVPVSGPSTVNFDMSGVEWTGTIRSSSDSTAVRAGITAYELETLHSASSTTDSNGAFRLIVRPNTYYLLRAGYVGWSATLGTFTSATDTTFTFYVDVPPLP